MSISIRVQGLQATANWFERAQVKMIANAAAAVEVTAHKVKADVRGLIGGTAHLPGLGPSVQYTKQGGPLNPEAVIEAKGNGQAALGDEWEFGAAGSGPHDSFGQALENNADDLFHGLTVAVVQATA